MKNRMSTSGNAPFVDPMPVVASVLSVSRPCMSGGGTDNDEDFCAGEGCGRRLSESEKSVGLCSGCQKKYMGRAHVHTIFMPISTLTFMPTAILTTGPYAMARRACTVPGCSGYQVKDSSRKGWHCSRGAMCGR